MISSLPKPNRQNQEPETPQRKSEPGPEAPRDVKLKKFQIAQVTKTPARTILNWTQHGLLKPQYPADGRGKISYYSAINAVEAKIFKLLSRRGLNLKTVKNLTSILPKEELEYLNPFSDDKNQQVFLIIKEDFERAEVTLTARKHPPNPNAARQFRHLGQAIEPKALGGALSSVDEDFHFLTVLNLTQIKSEIKHELENL
jgi:DNA-binding transcriptional MerR regulator